MKLIIVIMTTFLMHVSASSNAQLITLKQDNVTLKRLFSSIKRQTGYVFLYKSGDLEKTTPVSVDVKNASIEQVLGQVFKNQNLEYSIDNKSVVVSVKSASFLDKLVDAFTPPVDVYGVVLDEKGMPLIGATIKVKGFQQSTTTDREGKFSLKGVDEKAMLVISFIGYAPKEVAVKVNLLISLAIQSAELQEVNVAYGKQEQRAITGAVQVLKGKVIENIPNASFDKNLQGLVPSLLVTSGNGQPGSGITNFVLRGVSTNADPRDGSTARNPLIVIDGVPVSQDPTISNTNNRWADYNAPITNPLAQLNSSDIESISILKDASAIALYGSKASNGVILVTTKKGKSGATTFNFRHQNDFATALVGDADFLNQNEYLELLYETYKNTPRTVNGVNTPWNDADILADLKTKFPVRLDGSFYPQPDWKTELYSTAISTNDQLSINGGNEKSRFYISLDYLNQNGVIKKTNFDRKGIRFNYDNNIATWLKLGLNSSLSYSSQKYSGSAQGGSGGVASTGPVTIFMVSPLNPIRLENGNLYENFKYGGYRPNHLNPVAAQLYNTNGIKNYTGLSNFFAEAHLLNSLTFRTNVGVNFGLSEGKEIADPRLGTNDVYISGNAPIGGKITESDGRRFNLIATNTINWSKSIDKVDFDIQGGQEAQVLNQKVLTASIQGFNLPYYDQISSPGVSSYGLPAGKVAEETLLSYFSRINVGLRNKYFLTTSIRTDGSSRFGADKRFGTYWSTGLGWLISEENLLKNNLPLISYLKVRGSVGAAGNAGGVDRFTPYTPIDAYYKYMNETAVVSPTAARKGNNNAKWEQTLTVDFGLESKFFNNRLSIDVDFYKKYTSNLIYSIRVPYLTGFGTMMANVGKLENKGVEVSAIGSILNSKRLGWDIQLNWSRNDNKITKIEVDRLSLYNGVFASEVGKPINSFYLAEWAGVNQDTGDPQYIGPEGITSDYGIAVNKNRQLFGTPQPEGFGSVTNTFRYVGFDLSAQFYFQYGGQIYNNMDYITDGALPYTNQLKSALDRWKKPGDIATNPKRVLNNPKSSEVYATTRDLYDGDFIRLQQLTFGYTFNSTVVKRLGLSNLRIYAQGYNLALWSKYKESDIANLNVYGQATPNYPNQKAISIGLNTTF